MPGSLNSFKEISWLSNIIYENIIFKKLFHRAVGQYNLLPENFGKFKLPKIKNTNESRRKCANVISTSTIATSFVWVMINGLQNRKESKKMSALAVNNADLICRILNKLDRMESPLAPQDYQKFWENFGKHLKLGCIKDCENHKQLAPLLRFFSSQSENVMIRLDVYVWNMKPDLRNIYYIASNSVTSAPFLEKLLEKALEVLLLVDPIDEVAIQNLKAFERNFIDIGKEDLDLGHNNEGKEKEIKHEFEQTCDWIKKRLGDKVDRVQISNHLGSSPCVLVSAQCDDRLMKAQTVGDTSRLELMRSRSVLEINPEHPIIRTLTEACKSTPDDEEALRAIDLLYDAALVSSGFIPENPAQLGGKIYEMMNFALAGKWGTVTKYQQQKKQQSHIPKTVKAEVVEPAEAGEEKSNE